jgi:hypothetical protein
MTEITQADGSYLNLRQPVVGPMEVKVTSVSWWGPTEVRDLIQLCVGVNLISIGWWGPTEVRDLIQPHSRVRPRAPTSSHSLSLSLLVPIYAPPCHQGTLRCHRTSPPGVPAAAAAAAASSSCGCFCQPK